MDTKFKVAVRKIFQLKHKNIKILLSNICVLDNNFNWTQIFPLGVLKMFLVIKILVPNNGKEFSLVKASGPFRRIP